MRYVSSGIVSTGRLAGPEGDRFHRADHSPPEHGASWSAGASTWTGLGGESGRRQPGSGTSVRSNGTDLAEDLLRRAHVPYR
jgi:hypothetical protein